MAGAGCALRQLVELEYNSPVRRDLEREMLEQEEHH
jgi:hypothetical protein